MDSTAAAATSSVSEKSKMIAGDLYRANDSELVEGRLRADRVTRAYNSTLDDDAEKRKALLKELLGSVADDVTIRSPFHCDYGYNIHCDSGVFLNFGCVVLDVTHVHIGAGTQIGPLVQILTADHPRDPAARAAGFENGKPINIGKNVWIGGGAMILPGVTIGDDAIIGAGSVVTRDVPPGTTVAGNPAKPLPRKV